MALYIRVQYVCTVNWREAKASIILKFDINNWEILFTLIIY